MNNDWREYYDPQYVLMHHGIKGMHWGVRRFQSADGSLTAAGKARYDGDKVSAKEKNAFSLKATGHKIAAKVYGANEKVYSKSNKALSSMNKDAKQKALQKASEAQKAANEKRQEKVTAYRDKLGEKALKRSERMRETADRAKYEMDDLKKYGAQSNTYQKWEAEQRLNDRRNSDISSGERFANEIFRSIGSSMKVQEMISDRENQYSHYSKRADSWMKTNKQIMNTSVGEFTTKKDVKRAFRQYANSN